MKYVYFLLIVILVSCSTPRKSDLELMRIIGSVSSIIENDYSKNDSLIITKYFEFDSLGYLNSVIYNTSRVYKKYTFNSKIINSYTSEHRIKETKTYRDDIVLLSQKYLNISTLFDSIILYDSENAIVGYGSLKYDKDYNVIESKLYDNNDKIITQEYSEYDKNSNLVRNESIGSNIFNFRHYYDSSFRRIKTISSNTDSAVIEYFTYIDDSIGNWVIKKTYNNDHTLIDSAVREIFYKKRWLTNAKNQ